VKANNIHTERSELFDFEGFDHIPECAKKGSGFKMM
jgi:hypothetical protein